EQDRQTAIASGPQTSSGAAGRPVTAGPGTTGGPDTALGPDTTTDASAGTVLVVDDADRLPSTAAEEWATYLSAHPEVALLGAGRAESVATTFHPLAVRLRDADLNLVLA